MGFTPIHLLRRDLVDDVQVPAASTEKITWGATASTRPDAGKVPSPLSQSMSQPQSRPPGQQDVQLLVDLYVSTVDDIAQLNRRKKELEAQRESMEEAIAVYALRVGVHQVIGSTRRIRVATEASAQLPVKERDPDRHAAFDRLLRSSPHWGEFSRFDRHALLRVWNGRGLDPGNVCELIGPFVEMRQKTKLVLLPSVGVGEDESRFPPPVCGPW